MRKIVLVVLALVLAVPAAAEWNVTASTATWQRTAPLADVQEARDAVLWQRERMALLGAVFTAALSNLTVTNNGDGTGTIMIALPRAGAQGGDAWIDAYAVDHCPEASTNQEKLDCVDVDILADLKQVVFRYRVFLRDQANPVAEPVL